MERMNTSHDVMRSSGSAAGSSRSRAAIRSKSQSVVRSKSQSVAGSKSRPMTGSRSHAVPRSDSGVFNSRSGSDVLTRLSSKSSMAMKSSKAMKKQIRPDAYAIPRFAVDYFGDNLHDSVAIIIHDGGSVLLAKHVLPNKSKFFPVRPLKANESWLNSAIRAASIILTDGNVEEIRKANDVPFTLPKPIGLLRVEVPELKTFVTRLVSYCQLKGGSGKLKEYEWVSLSDITSKPNHADFWGPEVWYFSKMIVDDKLDDSMFYEYSVEEAKLYLMPENAGTKEADLLQSVGIGPSEVDGLYTDYLHHVFPSFYMTEISFHVFLVRLGWKDKDPRIPFIFRAFNVRRNGFLTFHEMLLGISAMDPSAEHGGNPGELRLGYIYRYYCDKPEKGLNKEEQIVMLKDIVALQNPGASDDKVQKEAEARFHKQLGGKDTLTYSRLFTVVGSRKLQGTHLLFRSVHSLRQFLQNRGVYEELLDEIGPIARYTSRRFSGLCANCRSKRYKIAGHVIKINTARRVKRDVTDCMYQGTTNLAVKAVGSTTTPIQTGRHTHGNIDKSTLEKMEVSEKISVEMLFNDDSNIRQIFSRMRAFASICFKDKPSQDRAVGLHLSVNEIRTVCYAAKKVFQSEPRMLKVTSPCFVFGDLHENFGDAAIYDHHMFPAAPALAPTSYLFLGDYVDRGVLGVELCLYMFCMKVMAPTKFFQIRGNHECRQLQRLFTFYRVVVQRFGVDVGEQVFEIFNECFDHLPLCAMIDEKIFCAHGGIPRAAVRVEELSRIPVPLPDPEVQSAAAWEILWNDPETRANMAALQGRATHMPKKLHFVENEKRGTGYRYGVDAINIFLSANALSHILRAHEVINPGYRFEIDATGRCLTVFSSSNYCGGSNRAATVFVDGERLRIIVFET